MEILGREALDAEAVAALEGFVTRERCQGARRRRLAA
jgi:hypothetical protein